ncbi:PIN domain-containing protein [Paenibacillus sp. P36]|uniref:PIN domain-containing protein n=1 Tax=Paenibacillus sp. P36 TaxID=3342538 RepID=UPI0038B29B66
MVIVDFNNPHEFQGFDQGEDILVDTGILLALASSHDPWHETVKELFDNYIFPEGELILLYTNPLVVNEVLHLSTRSLKNFTERFGIMFSDADRHDLEAFIENMLTIFIEEGILKVLEGDKDSVLHQIKLKKHLGSADAANVSLANLYGTNFLTLDNILKNNMVKAENFLPNIKKIYYTTPLHMSYR